MKYLKPNDLAPLIRQIVRTYGDKWLSINDVWKILSAEHPEAKKRIEQQVERFIDPEKNNAKWFIYWACYHAADPFEIEFSRLEEHPEVQDTEKGIIRQNALAENL
jgi:hypothetical protein